MSNENHVYIGPFYKLKEIPSAEFIENFYSQFEDIYYILQPYPSSDERFIIKCDGYVQIDTWADKRSVSLITAIIISPILEEFKKSLNIELPEGHFDYGVILYDEF